MTRSHSGRLSVGGFFILVSILSVTVTEPSGMARTLRSDLDHVVEAVKELFPEIESQTRIEGREGATVRLEATIGFSKARERVLTAARSLRKMAGGSTLDNVEDHWRDGRMEATVRVRGGWAVGGFSMERKGMDVVISVFAARVADDEARLPARPVVPQPIMFLFPL